MAPTDPQRAGAPTPRSRTYHQELSAAVAILLIGAVLCGNALVAIFNFLLIYVTPLAVLGILVYSLLHQNEDHRTRLSPDEQKLVDRALARSVPKARPTSGGRPKFHL